MTGTISPEMQRLITRARERMAEQDAHNVKQREANYTIDGRHAEFCGAFREILDMLAEQIEREAAAQPVRLGPFVPGGEFEAQS